MGKARKVRADKRREVAPTLSTGLKDCIYRLSFIVDMPIKDVAEEICKSGMERGKVMSHLSQHFIRDIRIGNTLYMGRPENEPVLRRIPGRTEKISIRFLKREYNFLDALSHAMGLNSVARACALLLDATIRDVDFVNDFVEEFLERHLDEERMDELKEILRYLNHNNPYDETISWARFFSYLVMDDIKENVHGVKDAVSDFVIKHWKK